MAPTPPHNGQKALAHQHGDRLTHGGAADPVVALQLLFAGDKIPLFVCPVCDFRLKILFCPTVQRLDSTPLPSSYRRHDIMMSIDTFSRLNRQNKYNFCIFQNSFVVFDTDSLFQCSRLAPSGRQYRSAGRHRVRGKAPLCDRPVFLVRAVCSHSNGDDKKRQSPVSGSLCNLNALRKNLHALIAPRMIRYTNANDSDSTRRINYV